MSSSTFSPPLRKCLRYVPALLLFSLALPACTPKVIVRKSPTDQDSGIRYYRPKPYLKIEPAEVVVNKSESTLVPGMVRVSLVYMPDFSEEYSISVRPGCGIADVGIKLEDGWNLTEISQELDSQTDENVEAIGSLLSAAGGLIPTSAREKSTNALSFTVPARNVPIGFYESVVGKDHCNVKRLYGFRYLGFMPFAGCPIEMDGHSHASCQAPGICGQHPTGSLYGLTFVGGEMVFQPLDVMAATPAVTAVSLGEKQVMSSEPAEQQTEGIVALKPPVAAVDVSQLSTDLRAHLNRMGIEFDLFDAMTNNGILRIRVKLPDATYDVTVHEAIEDWLSQRYPDLDSFDIEMTSDFGE
ncbi:hypothetical protein [Novipirellula aureliae]|nr:hypothetical protein [Novipirellula aureliae]